MPSIDNFPFNLAPPGLGYAGSGPANVTSGTFDRAAAQVLDGVAPQRLPGDLADAGSPPNGLPPGGLPPYGAPPNGFGNGGLGGVLNGFFNYISNLFNLISGWFGGQLGGGSSIGPQQYFQTAQASSWGDPHDAFSGAGVNGQNLHAAWDNMSSHPELLTSDSFDGGLIVSTQVTQPDQKGVTHNQSATVATNDGNTRVSLNADGSASITSYGQTYSLQDGQSLNLGNGETVTKNADGSLSVNMQNARGGSLSVNLTAKQGGVDVQAQGRAVDLGGYLVTRTDGGTGQGVGNSPYAPPQGPVGAPYPPASPPFGSPTQPAGTQPNLPYAPFQAQPLQFRPLPIALSQPSATAGSAAEPSPADQVVDPLLL